VTSAGNDAAYPI